jgi:hypothetical protein
VHVVGRVLNRHGITWWAFGGTLLGAVRNKGIIAHDDDLDFGTLDFDKFNSSSLEADLRRNGYTMGIRTTVGSEKVAIWPLSIHNSTNMTKTSDFSNLWLDVFPHHIEKGRIVFPDRRIHAGLSKRNQMPAYLCNKTANVSNAPSMLTSPCPGLVSWQFGDTHVWGPPKHEAQDLFSRVFGPTWRVPSCHNSFHACQLLSEHENATGRAEPCGQPLPEVL